MPDDKQKHETLVERLTEPGWRLIPTGIDPAVEGTLEDMARAAHQRKQSGKDPGTIRRLENEVELDLLDLEQLWWHMGLPT
jgi:hypothetical protein